jgi:hypothetical protein
MDEIGLNRSQITTRLSRPTRRQLIKSDGPTRGTRAQPSGLLTVVGPVTFDELYRASTRLAFAQKW